MGQRIIQSLPRLLTAGAVISLTFLLSKPANAQTTLTEITNTGVTPLGTAKGAFFDSDNDNDLDLLVQGTDSGGADIGVIFRNDALDGHFASTALATVPLNYPANSIADVNLDGKLDFIVGGYDSNGDPRMILYENQGSSITILHNFSNPIAGGAYTWGDYDRDGDVDLALNGGDASGAGASGLYSNTSGVLSPVPAALANVYDSAAEWVDYDNDGDLDLYVAGDSSGINPNATVLYKNTNELLVPDPFFNDSVVGSHPTSWDWADFDADGDLDLAVTGFGAVSALRIYENNGGIFSTYATLPYLSGGSLQFGDLDNDGDLDLVACGNNQGLNLAKIYVNDNGTFTDQGVLPLVGVTSGVTLLGDVDNDGDLDFFVLGNGGFSFVSRTYITGGITPNTAPDAPTGLSATINPDSSITFQWQAPTGDETPSAGLSYSLWIGTTEHGTEVTAAPADTATGYRRVVEYGQVKTTTWTLKNVSCDNEYWFRVQAVDGGYMGSEFSPAAHVVLSPTATVVQNGNILSVNVTGGAASSVQWVDGQGTPLANGDSTSYILTDTMLVGVVVTRDFCSTTVPAQNYIFIAANEPTEVSNVKIWPNPSSTVLHVRVDNPGATEAIAIYDMQGRVMHAVTAGFNTETTLPVDGLASGLYLVKLSLKNGRGIATATFRKD